LHFALDDKHNIPLVKRCSVDINKSVYDEKDFEAKLHTLPKASLSRRFVEDTYLCIYVDPDGVMYQ